MDDLFEAFEICVLLLAGLQEWTRGVFTCNLRVSFTRVVNELFEAFEICVLLLAGSQEWTRGVFTCNLRVLVVCCLWKGILRG